MPIYQWLTAPRGSWGMHSMSLVALLAAAALTGSDPAPDDVVSGVTPAQVASIWQAATGRELRRFGARDGTFTSSQAENDALWLLVRMSDCEGPAEEVRCKTLHLERRQHVGDYEDALDAASGFRMTPYVSARVQGVTFEVWRVDNFDGVTYRYVVEAINRFLEETRCLQWLADIHAKPGRAMSGPPLDLTNLNPRAGELYTKSCPA